MSTRLRLSAAAIVAVGAAATFGALAGPAAAETFCAPAPCSPGTPAATIEQAVDAADANPGPDTVQVGPGEHTVSADNACGGGVVVGNPETSLRGAGVRQTVITGQDLPPDAGFTRTVVCGYMGSLSDLTIRLPSAVTTGNATAQGADVYDGVVENVRIDADGASFGPGINDGEGAAMLIRNGRVSGLEIDLGFDRDTSGLRTVGWVEIEDVRASAAGSGISSRVDNSVNPGPMPMRRLELRARRPLTILNESGSDSTATVSDALLDASGAPGGEEVSGATIFNGLPPKSISARLDRVTMIGNGNPESAALTLYGQGMPLPTAVHGRHLVADGFGRSLFAGLYGGDVEARIDYSNIDLSGAKLVTDGAGAGELRTSFGPGNRIGPAYLLDPGSGDYRLTHRSPGVDIGGDPLLPAPPTDLFGAPRLVDGDGDGSILGDAGAYEHQNNNFRLLKLRRNKRKGTAKLTIALPAPGTVELRSKKLKRARSSRDSAGRVKLAIRPKGKAKRRLKRKRRVNARAVVDYTSEAVLPRSKSKRIRLVRKRR